MLSQTSPIIGRALAWSSLPETFTCHLGIAHYQHMWVIVIVLYIFLDCEIPLKQFSSFTPNLFEYVSHFLEVISVFVLFCLWVYNFKLLWMKSSCMLPSLASLESQILLLCFFFSVLFCARIEEFQNNTKQLKSTFLPSKGLS